MSTLPTPAKTKPTLPRRRWWQIGIIGLIFVVTLIVFCILSLRVIGAVRAWHQPPTPYINTSGVQPWMTVSYIARTYRVPESELLTALNLPATDENRRTPLGVLARRNHQSLDANIAAINSMLVARHATPRPPPSPGSRP